MIWDLTKISGQCSFLWRFNFLRPPSIIFPHLSHFCYAVSYLEALKNLEEANKNVREAARELQHYVLEGEKEEQYYFSKGCTKQNDAIMACPIGTPSYQVKDYVPQE
jgi:hypothetical protein